MAIKIYMVIGCPCSGKSYVCERLKDRYHYVRHDDHIGDDYLGAIVRQHATATKPLLIETPFSVSQIKDPLEQRGFEVVPVIIQEHFETLRARYLQREGKNIPAGHLSRQNTYVDRARAWNAFVGTSGEVLEHLLKQRARMPWE